MAGKISGGPPLPSAPLKSGSRNSLRPSDDPRAAVRAEHDARQRIQELNRQVDQAQNESSQRMDHIHDEFIRQHSAESTRSEAAIEAERNKGYQAIRELQRANQKELERLKREGERELAKTQEHYRNTLDRVEHTGESEINTVRNDKERLIETTHKEANVEAKFEEQAYRERNMTLRNQHEEAIAQQQEAYKKNYEELKERTEAAKEQAEVEFKKSYETVRTQQSDSLENLDRLTARKLNELRADTAQKLAAYDERQRDPFYKLTRMEAELEEYSDAYVLFAVIPPHEQPNIAINIRGDQVVLSGFRRNEEKLESEPGSVETTNSYQSFSKTFPIGLQVEARGIQKTFDGDVLIVRIPKRGTYAPAHPAHKKEVARARAERPQFPGNLPLAHHPKPEETEEGAPIPPTPRGPGSKTLG